jgi:hypothetical protein
MNLALAAALPAGSAAIAQETYADAEFTPPKLAERTLHRRAVEAVIWAMPAVNFERMLQAAKANGASPSQVVCWSRPVNAKNQTLTPNPDTIYFNPFYDTSAGPVVLEIRPAEGVNHWHHRRRVGDQVRLPKSVSPSRRQARGSVRLT